jgi:hypothetical protein
VSCQATPSFRVGSRLTRCDLYCEVRGKVRCRYISNAPFEVNHCDSKRYETDDRTYAALRFRFKATDEVIAGTAEDLLGLT